MNHIVKRSVSFMLALCMIAVMIPGFALGASAAELTGLSDSTIGLDYTAAANSGVVEWTAAGTSVNGLVQGAAGSTGKTYKAESSTLTITNNKGSEAILSFSYSITANRGTVKIDGAAVTGSGSYTSAAKIPAGGSVKIVLNAPAGLATAGQPSVKLVISDLRLVADRDASTVFTAAENGSYTVDGTAITADTTLVKNSSESFALAATPAEGYVFYGWYNETTGSYISYNAQYSYQTDSDSTIKPVFVVNTTAVFEVNGVKFLDLNEAGNYAVSKGLARINLVHSGTISGDFTIPAGVTLLIPFDENYTCYTTTPECAGNTWTQPVAYKTLTLAAGSSITVNGAISVSAKHTAGSSANGKISYAGAPTGSCGFLTLKGDSEIILKKGGALYAWGYVIGSGSVTAESGAVIYENMQFTDFRGGEATSNMAIGDMASYKVFPMSQYYVQNIEVATTLMAGAEEYVFTSIFMSNTAFSSGVKFIGEGAMFVAGEGSKIIKTYLPGQDRLKLDVVGDAAINSLAIELEGNRIDSSAFVLPITSNISINILSGETTINQDIALLPGSTVSIAEGAQLNLAAGFEAFVYDADTWDLWVDVDLTTMAYSIKTGGNFVNQGKKLIPVAYSPTRTYTRSNADIVDVTVDVNGKLVVDGYIYTTLGGVTSFPYETCEGANIISSKGSGLVVLNGGLSAGYLEFVEMVGSYFTYQVVQNGAALTPAWIPVNSAMLHNSDGSYVSTNDLVAGDAYINNSGSWSKVIDVSVSFNAGGGSGEMAAVTVTKDQILSGSNTVTLASNAFTRTGYTFQGWATSENGAVVYKDGASVTVTSDLTLYAVWKINTYGVTFNGTDVTSDGASSVQYGSAYTAKLTVAQCRALEAKDITVTIGGKAYAGFTYADGVLTIPANAVTGEIIITAAATVSHTESAPVQENVVAATCKDEGSYDEVVYCGVCGEELSRETKTIEKLTTHTRGTPVTENVSSETCEQGGSYDTVVYCTVCGAELNRVTTQLAAPGHSYESVKTAPTCEAKGYTTYTCTVCGDSYVGDEVNALGHSYTKYESNADATCTADGTKTAVCDNGCGKKDTKTDAGSALGHAYESVVTAPTCENQGYTTNTCTRCGDSYVGDEVKALGHKYTAYKPNGDATCEEDGTKTAICDNGCGKEDTKTDAGSALGHAYESVVTAPTCEEKGYTTYTCARCGDSYVGDEVKALGHKYTAYKPNGDATCEKDGTKTASCDNGCGKTDTVADTGSALGHDYKAKVTAPTCEEKGYTTYTCTRCGGSYVADYVDALGHKYTSYKSNGDATCEEDGTKTAICDNGCGKTDTVADKNSALGHDYNIVVTAPTCTEQGYSTYTCVRCGDSFVDDTADATGHHYVDGKCVCGDVLKYTITFVDESGKVLQSGIVEHGTVPAYTGETPVKANSATSTFEFSGWTPAVVAAEGNATYTVVFTESLKNGFYNENGGIYHYIDGKLSYAGLIEVDGAYYYVRTSTGEVVTNRTYWITYTNGLMDEGNYIFDEQGKMIGAPEVVVKNGFYNENGGIYHYVDGQLSRAGLIEVDGKYYYVRTTTGEVVTGRTYWVTYTNDLVTEGNYTFDEQGAMVDTPAAEIKNGFYEENGGIYHYVDGKLSCAGLIKVDGYYYYVRTTSGEVVTNRIYWVTYTNDLMEEGNYNFDSKGRMTNPTDGSYVKPEDEVVKNGFVSENGGIYYYEDGVMLKCGLIEVDGEYYYIRTTSGEVVTNRTYWITYTNGLMEEGNYTFDAQGRMILD